jgi:hypothetical protein
VQLYEFLLQDLLADDDALEFDLQGLVQVFLEDLGYGRSFSQVELTQQFF